MSNSTNDMLFLVSSVKNTQEVDHDAFNLVLRTREIILRFEYVLDTKFKKKHLFITTIMLVEKIINRLQHPHEKTTYTGIRNQQILILDIY